MVRHKKSERRLLGPSMTANHQRCYLRYCQHLDYHYHRRINDLESVTFTTVDWRVTVGPSCWIKSAICMLVLDTYMHTRALSESTAQDPMIHFLRSPVVVSKNNFEQVRETNVNESDKQQTIVS